MPTKRLNSLERRAARAGWVYAAPALTVVCLITVFPIVMSMVLGLSDARTTGTGIAISEWSFDNYAALLASEKWWNSLAFTALYTVVSVSAQMVIGVAAAVVLANLAGARGWIMVLLLIPWAMINVANAQLWAYIYNASYGIATWLLLPVTGAESVILGSPTSAIVAMIISDTWKSTPLIIIMVLAALVMLPQSPIEAARVDGASAWQTFWHVTLPQLRTAIAVALMFRVLQAFGVFDLPFVLTQGGPGTATTSLSLLSWRLLFSDLQLGAGSAVATGTALIVLVICLLFLRVFKAQVGREEL